MRFSRGSSSIETWGTAGAALGATSTRLEGKGVGALAACGTTLASGEAIALHEDKDALSNGTYHVYGGDRTAFNASWNPGIDGACVVRNAAAENTASGSGATPPHVIQATSRPAASAATICSSARRPSRAAMCKPMPRSFIVGLRRYASAFPNSASSRDHARSACASL